MVELFRLAGGQLLALGGDEFGQRRGHFAAALQQGVAHRYAVSAHRLFAEAQAVAGRAVDGHFALRGQRLAEEELLLLQGILGPDHREADAGGLDEFHLVPGFKFLDETLERREITFAQDGVVVVSVVVHPPRIAPGC